MSSTYAYDQDPPLHAVLSRFSTHEGPTDDLVSSGDDSTAVRRRGTVPFYPYFRPLEPTIGIDPQGGSKVSAPPNENTPLISPPVPRVEEVSRHRSVDIGSGMVMFWEELRILIKYALPVFGTHLLEYSLVIVPVVSIGHLSTDALAAVSLGSMTASVTGFTVLQGFSGVLDTMLPSAWTSPHPELVGLWSQRMTVVMSASLIPMFLVWFNAETILLSLRQEPEVAHLASTYLRWVSLGLPAYAFNCISRRYFQSQGLFAVPTRIIFVVAPLNAFLNYILVWGPKPIQLGFIGAPIATAISFNLVSAISIIYGVFFVDRAAWCPLSRRMFTGLGLVIQLGLSGVVQTASEWWAWELVGLAASLYGPASLATQSVLLTSSSTTFQAPYALGVATSVRIGNLLGEQKAMQAGMAAKTAIMLALVLSMIPSAMFLVFRNVWGYLFNDDPEVITLVASMLPLVALFQVFDATSAVTGGIMRAMGKQFTGALLNLSAYYLLGIPVGIWFAFWWDMKLHGLWIGLTLSLVYCSVLGIIICLRSDWEYEVKKVMNRLKAEAKAREEDMRTHCDRRGYDV